MIDGLTVYAVIAARGGSSRLPRKNIYPVWGKPMLYWVVRACQQSQYIDRVFVSTEDEEIAGVAQESGAEVIRRPKELAEGHIFKQDVIVHAAEGFDPKPDLVISLQPNSPELCPSDLDNAIRKLKDNDRNEIFSVGEDLLQNAAFRIMKYDYVFQKSISTRSGVYQTNYVDVHYKEDVEFLNQNRKPCTKEA